MMHAYIFQRGPSRWTHFHLSTNIVCCLCADLSGEGFGVRVRMSWTSGSPLFQLIHVWVQRYFRCASSLWKQQRSRRWEGLDIVNSFCGNIRQTSWEINTCARLWDGMKILTSRKSAASHTMLINHCIGKCRLNRSNRTVSIAVGAVFHNTRNTNFGSMWRCWWWW